MKNSWSQWLPRALRKHSRKPITRVSRPTTKLAFEHVEDRITPASYNWDGASNLTISLGADDRLNVSELAGNITFTLTTGGGFGATGTVAPTDLGTSIAFAAGDISTSLRIDDADDLGAVNFDNDVHFVGGTVTSATITVALTTSGGEADDIFFDGGAIAATGTATITTTSGAISSLGNAAIDVLVKSHSVSCPRAGRPE